MIITWSPAGIVYKWFGKREWDTIATKYNILPWDYAGEATNKVWAVFTEAAKELEN